MTRTCDVPGCEREHWGHGHCSRHYQEQRRARTEGPVCKVERCERIVKARGLCNVHLCRLYFHGDPEAPVRNPDYTAREDRHLLDLPTEPKSGYVKRGALAELATAFGRSVQSLSTRRRKLLREREAA